MDRNLQWHRAVFARLHGSCYALSWDVNIVKLAQLVADRVLLQLNFYSRLRLERTIGWPACQENSEIVCRSCLQRQLCLLADQQ